MAADSLVGCMRCLARPPSHAKIPFLLLCVQVVSLKSVVGLSALSVLVWLLAGLPDASGIDDVLCESDKNSVETSDHAATHRSPFDAPADEVQPDPSHL